MRLHLTPRRRLRLRNLIIVWQPSLRGHRGWMSGSQRSNLVALGAQRILTTLPAEPD
jgi:hypothetical protein